MHAQRLKYHVSCILKSGPYNDNEEYLEEGCMELVSATYEDVTGPGNWNDANCEFRQVLFFSINI